MIKTRKEIVIIGLMLVLIIAIIGVSYAAFRFTGEGQRVNTITTGSITMSYEESSNTISLNGALPTRDATGKVRLTEGEYFDFTVSSQISGDVNINYEISAKDVTSSDRKIDGSNIKLYLTRLTDDGEEELMIPEVYNEESTSNSYTGRPSGEMSLYTSSMNSSESNRYRLRMWVSDDYNPQGDGGNLTFSVQINVYGKDGLSMEDRMMRTAGSEDFHSSEYRSKITSIVTKGDTVIPEGVIESWDISEKQNGSVIAYAEDDGTGLGTYKVTIGGEGKIIANKSMMDYFYNFSNLTSIDLTYLDTSLVTNMVMMFSGCSSLTELDLSNFNTSNVTSMSYMFAISLTSGISMKLEQIIFGETFDTSKVTTMMDMFYGCTELKKLDLSMFNTSKVTDMSSMFNSCRKLTELDLSSFNTSNVTNVNQMFQYCDNLTELDLRNFNTTKVKSSSKMFNDMPNITEILVTRDTWTIPNSTLAGSGITDFTYV